MIWKASHLDGYAIEALDGRLGVVSDFLFDDTSWSIRWLVVDTGKWLTGRKVLLPVSVLGHVDESRKAFSVRLTMQQIKDSPDVDADRPVSRQMESSVYDYYGWTPYWSTGMYVAGYGYLGRFGYPEGVLSGTLSPRAREREEMIANANAQRDDGDPHLRRMNSVPGHHIHATDGEIGHVMDLFVEDADWSLRYLLVDTRNWWPGKHVLVSPHSVKSIDWTHRLVNLDVDRRAIKESPAYEPGMTIDRAFQWHYHSYYGGVRPSHLP
jgi:uncharacterized protein YrrD